MINMSFKKLRTLAEAYSTIGFDNYYDKIHNEGLQLKQKAYSKNIDSECGKRT